MPAMHIDDLPNDVQYFGASKIINGITVQHGEGTQVWPGGTKYVGSFLNGKYHGYGEETNEEGFRY